MDTSDPSNLHFHPFPPPPPPLHPFLSWGGPHPHSDHWNGPTTPLLTFIPAFLVLLLLIAFFSLYFFRHSLLRRLSVYFSLLFPTAAPVPTATAGRARSPLFREEASKGGLAPAILRSFPILTYAGLREGKVGPDCAVCLSEFDSGDEVRLLTACCHVFHPGCIDPWLVEHSTCPVCRSDLRAPPDSAALAAVEEAISGSHVITVGEDPDLIGRSRDDREEEEEEEEEEERSTIRDAGREEEPIVR